MAASLATFFGFYVSYYVICLRSVRAKRPRNSAEFSVEKLPFISIIVPIYNEKSVISTKMDNFEKLNYPRDRLEAIFVDGGSNDGTVDLLENRVKSSNITVKIVKQGSRKGFNNAVVEGFSETVGEIIFITGAETEYDVNTLNIVVSHFSDPRVGAVTGRQIIKNINQGYSPKLEGAYRNLYDFLRQAESNIDSPFDLKGEISAARREIVKKLVENPQLRRRGCIDACFSFQGRMDGYKTVYDPRAVYYEPTTTMIKESFKQQVRRAATLIENMLSFKNMIFKREFGAFGMLIMPAHFMMLMILPYFLLVGCIGLFVLVAMYPLNYFLDAIVVASLAGLVLSRTVQAFVKTQLTLILATFKLLKGTETQKFERLQSARPI